jgi:OFA family oxalate/formate antiporter-like MFS transporter
VAVTDVLPFLHRFAEKWFARRREQLAVCVLAMVAIATPQYTWTLFTVPLADGLGASLSQIQVAFTLFILAQSLLVPVLGYVTDRLGARLVVASGGILLGISWVGAGIADSLVGLYLAYTVGGVGVAAVYGACVGLALKWFPDRRGMATGLVVGAYGSGAALSVMPIRTLIEGEGYRTAFVVWGLIQCMALLASAWPMLTPLSGWRPAGGGAHPAVPSPVESTPRNTTPSEMVRSRTFHLLYLVAVLVTFGGLMVTAQLKPIAAAYGINRSPILPGVDALAGALMATLSVGALARPFWGLLSDRIGRYRTMSIAYAVGAAAIVGLILSLRSPWGFVLFSALTVFAWGASFVLFSAAIGDAFGVRYAATNSGIHYTSKGVSAIFAAWGAARLVELTGSWLPALWVAAACNGVAAVITLFILGPMVARAKTRSQKDSSPVVRSETSTGRRG